ncbi:hypothetical protein [Magnetofaba australis]|uniref:Putative acyl-CoA transferases/carnitine dehydratase n=1 Tax=Magnetofaba australis IT-1 TaxID=1434232 RepID=A0A1Y2K9C5_9PROT|nr:hypothetical protein [Magnetofaba australis]OSM07354.1 putative acyl-CoA transferases/carnitine dehydratase [Magnetofaba australis IT-1]
MGSKAEQILQALTALLQAISGPTVLRNAALPTRIPPDGVIILRDGDPGEPEQSLGGVGGCYYQHSVEIEIIIQHGDADQRQSLFDDLLLAVAGELDADSTLGGLIYGMTYGRPAIQLEHEEGAAPLLGGVIELTLDYETASPIS